MKNRNLLIILLLASLSMVLGCFSVYQIASIEKASGPVFTAAPVPAGKAVVYFFRSDKFMMSKITIFISIPKEANNCFKMVKAGYYSYIANPGELTVSHSSTHDGNKEYTIDLEAGDVKYVKVDFNDDMLPKSFYQEIPADQALPEISKYRMIEPCK
jgi:hypothetical protein